MNDYQPIPIAGVMGWPVSHSLSPALHGFWLRENKVIGNYVPLAVQPQNLQAAILALPKLGFSGVNLTVPHKEAAALFVDRVDGVAKTLRAINTVVVNKEGLIIGTNTDGYGFIESLKRSLNLNILKKQTAVILGAGGAARAIAAALKETGVSEINIVNRTRENSERLCEEVGDKLIAVDWKERNEVLEGKKLLVNTTILGMVGQPALDINLSALPLSAIVSDIVYAPLITPLLKLAIDRGNTIVDGLGMLLQQGRPGFRAWFGVDPKVSEDLEAHLLGQIRGLK
ncbi:MAG: shikimate dehydrogenase [Rhodospirillales bacterium]|nr:shikimate dehydrogenase [Rhodospirillales bacterium]|tara:strand:+ start:6376 stop:7230 length:855 start_codon:yes stop_codon:yes gene_type:complete